MRLVVLAGAALAFTLLGSPAATQQAPGTATPGEVQPQSPPPTEPPPFPPYPPEPSHRWVDLGEHHARSSHHHRPTRHHAAARRHRHAHAHHAIHKRYRSSRFSARTIHRCHRMTYKLIMRDNLCRAMMTRDLKKARHRHHALHRRASAHRHRHTVHHHRA
jgi:hypothetical protein